MAGLLMTAALACTPSQGGAERAEAEDVRFSAEALAYDRTKIELVSTDTYVVGEQTYRRLFYRNRAYTCGRSGFFTFVVLEPRERVGQRLPLWVGLRGGGTGYYGADGRYHPGQYVDGLWKATSESQNDENPVAVLANTAVQLGQPGARLAAFSMCDHDLYGGVGGSYWNNPHRPGDKVQGLLASMAALHFILEGNGLTDSAALSGYPTDLVFLHGSSAGSAGAYHLSAALAREGFFVNGAILDSYVLTTRHPELFAANCTPTSVDPEFDYTQLVAKLGPVASDPSLYLENNVPGPYAVPYLLLQGALDAYCCGNAPALPGAVSGGFDNNCRYVFDTVAQSFAASGSPLAQVVILEGAGHVVRATPGGKEAISSWLSAVLASGPVAPAFP